jgi:hypothetical protein
MRTTLPASPSSSGSASSGGPEQVLIVELVERLAAVSWRQQPRDPARMRLGILALILGENLGEVLLPADSLRHLADDVIADADQVVPSFEIEMAGGTLRRREEVPVIVELLLRQAHAFVRAENDGHVGILDRAQQVCVGGGIGRAREHEIDADRGPVRRGDSRPPG